MERVSEDQFKRASLRDEHFHRYEFAARISQGAIVDCACGIGYSSDILLRHNNIDSYIGIDPSPAAIEHARKSYPGERIKFEVGTLESNSCPDASVDTFLSFETLEHTATPQVAVEQIRRCLKPNGLLIGSVPSAEYEALCEVTYGTNPFHLHRFSPTEILELLSTSFEAVRLFSAEFILGTLIRPLNSTPTSEGEIASRQREEIDIAGSIIFIAGPETRVNETLDTLGTGNMFFPSLPKVILDKNEIEPIRKAFYRAEAGIRERDKAINDQARMLEERWKIIQSMDKLIQQRDHVIESQTQMLEDRWKAMQSMDAMIRERDELLNRQTRELNERITVPVASRNLLTAIGNLIFRFYSKAK